MLETNEFDRENERLSIGIQETVESCSSQYMQEH